MSKTFRVGVVGCGGIANGKHLPSLAAIENVEIVYFCDIVRERAEKACEKYGAQGAKVHPTAPTVRFPAPRWRRASMFFAKSLWR